MFAKVALYVEDVKGKGLIVSTSSTKRPRLKDDFLGRKGKKGK